MVEEDKMTQVLHSLAFLCDNLVLCQCLDLLFSVDTVQLNANTREGAETLERQYPQQVMVA